MRIQNPGLQGVSALPTEKARGVGPTDNGTSKPRIPPEVLKELEKLAMAKPPTADQDDDSDDDAGGPSGVGGSPRGTGGPSGMGGSPTGAPQGVEHATKHHHAHHHHNHSHTAETGMTPRL